MMSATTGNRRRAIIAGAFATTVAAGFILPNLAGAGTSVLGGGGATNAHYSGSTSGTQSTVVVHKGDQYLERTVHPSGTVAADADLTTGVITNIVAHIDSIDTPILPGPFSSAPFVAHVDTTVLGTPTGTSSPSGVSGVYNVATPLTTRVAVTIKAAGTNLTDPSTCFVDIPLNLTGTLDLNTNVLNVGQAQFTIPSFPSPGCGLFGPALTAAVSGSNNTMALTYG